MGDVAQIADARQRRGGFLALLGDGIANLRSRLGTTFDRQSQNVYFAPILSQQQIEASYRSSWLSRKVHDLVPFEMTRAGREWQAEKDQIEPLEAAEIALDLWSKIEEALRTARLHGGAAIILGVRQGSPNQAVRVDALLKGSLRYAIVVSRFQLFAPEGFDRDPESDFFGQPAMWEMRGQRGNRVKVHPSRVICFKGAPLPPGTISVSEIDQFWGDPLLISIKSAIENADITQAGIATLIHELKQDVISIPGLTELIASDDAEAKISARIEAINWLKSMFSTVLLDRGDGVNEASGEKWETRQVSFAQHPELLRAFLGIVAGAADIPVTRLMGESPGGLQSTGKGEQVDFNRMIEAQQKARLAPQLARIDEILIRSTLGSRPPDIYSTFAPLEESDPKEDSENEKREAETVEIYTRTNLIPVDALAKAAVNRLIESGRWPGLDKAIDESKEDPGEAAQEDAQLGREGLRAANENQAETVGNMEAKGTVTRDQAISLLVDASPRPLYVRRQVLNAAEIIAWATKAVDKGGAGLATTLDAADLHVTVIYSRTAVDWMKMGQAWDWGDEARDGKLTIAPGGPRVVETFGSNKVAVVLSFVSNNLWARHEDMKREGASHDFDYQPHITLTYDPPEGFDPDAVTPYNGRILLGPEIFEQVDEDWGDNRTEA